MGVVGVSWRPTLAVIITVLQIQALISVKTTVLSGAEGQKFDIRCEYPRDYTNTAKYFCRSSTSVDDDESPGHLIRSETHDRWVTDGRFALYDNTSGAFFTVTVDKLESSDGGTYWCGVDVFNMEDHISIVKLNVFRDPGPTLYGFIVVCASAIVFVCVFTFGLLLAVKNARSRSRSRRDRPMSLDYESIADVRTKPENWRQCSDPGCTERSSLPPTGSVSPPITSKQRDSAVSLSHGDEDIPHHPHPYEDLDPSSLEDHIYYSLDLECETSKETSNSELSLHLQS